MESTSPAPATPSTGRTIDAAHDLALLERAKSAGPVDHMLDFGPWWYAPLLASLVGSLTLFGEGGGTATNVIFAVVAIAVAAGLSIHDHRRRKVRVRPGKKSFWFIAGMVLVVWAVVTSWGAAISSSGYEAFVPGRAGIFWAATTMILLAIRAVLGFLRSRRSPLS